MNFNPQRPQTGNAKLTRAHFFNPNQEDIDVPDGDVEFGKKMYNYQCAGCHNVIGQGPNLFSIYGSRGGAQKQFVRYSHKTRQMKSVKWSRQRLFKMLQCPQLFFGIQSAMTYQGEKDPYVRASIVQYLHFMRFTQSQSKKIPSYMIN